MRLYYYLSVSFWQKMTFTSDTMMDESKLRHVRLDNSTLMPNMGITKWSKNYDVNQANNSYYNTEGGFST